MEAECIEDVVSRITEVSGEGRMRLVLQPCRIGASYIEYFEITEEQSQLTELRQALNPHRMDYVSPGKYVRLVVDGNLMMTDTSM
jgi:hypothetical protein